MKRHELTNKSPKYTPTQRCFSFIFPCHQKLKTGSFILFILLFVSSCRAPKPYEMIYLNDPEMQMDNDAGRNQKDYVNTIREGSTQSGSTKSGGGCGCN